MKQMIELIDLRKTIGFIGIIITWIGIGYLASFKYGLMLWILFGLIGATIQLIFPLHCNGIFSLLMVDE